MRLRESMTPPFTVYKGVAPLRYVRGRPEHYKGGSAMYNEQWNEEWLAEEEEDEDDEWLLEIFRQAKKEDEGNIYLQNPRQVERVLKVYRLMKQVTAGQEVEVTYRLHDTEITMGSVTVEGFCPEFRDVETFAAAVLLADNIDMVAKTKGTVELCFTFHGLAKKIGRVDV